MVKRGILLLAASALAPAPLSAQTVEDRARAAAEASRAKTSDSDAIQQNYLTPGLAGQPISTVDNSRTFNPNIACQKTVRRQMIWHFWRRDRTERSASSGG